MVARTEPAEPNRAVIEAAAFWQTQLADEHCDEESRRAFYRWLLADRSHKIAFDRMSAISGKIASQSVIERTALGFMLDRKRWRGASMLLVLVSAGAMLTWLGAKEPAVRSRLADEQTEVGEQHRRALESGDKLVFDTTTAADVDDKRREIRLWHGGVMADVTSALDRPFVIRTPQGSARALGTQFSVRSEGGITTVSVIESTVEACASAGNRTCLVLTAGQSARMDASGVSRTGDIDPISEKAWGDGLLVVHDRPLTQVIDNLNRYRSAPIRYSAQDLSGLHVSGTFPLVDTERALVSLQAALPVKVERSDHGISIRHR